MGRSTSAIDGRPHRFTLSTFVLRQVMSLCGFAIFFALALAVAALATWNVADPSLSYATGKEPTNILGFGGAAFADVLMQFFGLSGVVSLLPVLAWSLALVSGRGIDRIPARLAAWLCGAMLCAAAMGCFPAPATWPIPNGIGGVIGDMILRFPALFVGAYPTGSFATTLGAVFAVPTAWLMLFAAGVIGHREIDDEDDLPVATPSKAQTVRDEYDDEDDGGSFLTNFLPLGALTHIWFTTQARVRRVFGLRRAARADRYEAPYDFNDDEFGTLNEPARARQGGERREPTMETRPAARRAVVPPSMALDDEDDDDDVLPDDILPDDSRGSAPRADVGDRRGRVQAPRASRPGAYDPAPRHPAVPGVFQLPALEYLAEPKNVVRDTTLSADALEQNARMLEGVLEDFGVKGEIIHVRPGPVVTLYELEPAPGIKSSRVIGLADDIARSMSAIAARVASCPAATPSASSCRTRAARWSICANWSPAAISPAPRPSSPWRSARPSAASP